MTAEARTGRLRALLARSARVTCGTLRAEWHAIVVDPVRRLARRGLSGLLLAFAAASGVVFFHDIAQHPAGALWVRRLGGVQADLPLWLSLLRTPVSLYVPALDLPVWAGLTQLFLAFALAELTLGRARTLVIAYATTLAGTLGARLMIALGPGWWGLGLPPEAGRVLDTGPSAAVVGLFTYLAVVRRAPVVFTLTGGAMVWESVAVPNLAGREHLIAVAAAIVLGLLHGRRDRLRAAVRSAVRSAPTTSAHLPSNAGPARRTPAPDRAPAAPDRDPVAPHRDRVAPDRDPVAPHRDRVAPDRDPRGASP
ncbi:hypothetical protein [Streptomyces sp. NPDC013455]|uniref:hypothetical protein n=1 Tax=Streptomyces sp. NPDC013455 TaxID=3155605 RepID=UPI00340C38A4